MAYLATVGSSKVNGLPNRTANAARVVLPDFAELYPDCFTNVTNGSPAGSLVGQP